MKDKRSKMKKHKKLECHEPKDDELTNRDRFELALLVLVCCFVGAAVIAFIIASVQTVVNGR